VKNEGRLLKEDDESGSFQFFLNTSFQTAVSLTFRFTIQPYHKEENNSNKDKSDMLAQRECCIKSIFRSCRWLAEKNGRQILSPQIYLPTSCTTTRYRELEMCPPSV
jgi:hypothetical protein